MIEPSDLTPEGHALRDQIIGLGAQSLRKSYYPQLQQQIDELKAAKAALEQTLKDLEVARQRAEENERKFRLLFEGITDGIIVVDPDTEELRKVNPAFCQMLGYSEAELLQLTIPSLHPPEELPQVREKIAKQKRGLTVLIKNLAFLRKDGTRFYADINGTAIDLENRHYVLGVCRDITERKQAEEQLHERDELMRYIIQHDPNAIAVFDNQLRYIFVSDRFLHDYNVKEQDVIGKPHYLIFPEMPEKWKAVHQRCLAGAVERNEDDSFVRLDGSITYVRWECRPWYRANGKIGGMIAYTEVTTERKLAEQKLQRSEADLGRAQAMAHLGSWSWDIVSDQVSWSDEMFRIYGVDPAAFTPSMASVMPLIHPDDLWKRDRALQEIIAGRSPESYDYRIIRPDGRERVIEVKGIQLELDPEGRTQRMFGVVQDITERKRDVDELHRLNRLYAVLSQVNQAVVHGGSQQELLEQICKITIEYGKFKMAWVGKINNETYQVIPIAEAGDAGGYLDHISVYADDRPEGRGPIGTSIREERTYVSNDFHHDPATLPWREAAVRVGFRAIISLPLRNEGKVYGAFAVYAGELDYFHDKEVKLLEEVASDVSFALDHLNQEMRRQQDEVALRQAKEEAEAANRAKDQFIAVLSHELRTPITPVLTAIILLQSREEMSDEIRAEMEIIRRNVELEAKLIDDLLDVTRISRGIIELHREEVDVHACLLKTLEICRSEIVEKGIEVVMNLRAKEFHVLADSARLQQVFWNLLKNAVKFTPTEGLISIGTTHTGKRLKIEIADTGIGIEPEILPRIFNAFEQGEQTRIRRFGGLGLGLSIAKAVVELHNGSLTAYSEGQNRGSVFTVELETITSTSGAVPSGKPPSAPKAGPCKILLVEDHADTLRILCRLLEKWGYRVECSDSVAQALDLAARESFDILISDLGLPDGSGLDIMRQTKERYGLRGIALSGFGTDDDLRRSREAGFEEHLTKPVGIEGLRAALERMLSQGPERK